jgi:hypothetical protein
MTPRFNLFFRWFANRFFGHFELGKEMVERLRDLEQRGSVVYVMRYSSRLDYLLFNALFLRDGLRLSRFANGLRFYYYRPILDVIRMVLSRKRGRSRAVEHGEDQQQVRRLTAEGESFFLFLRTKRLNSFWRGMWRMKQRQDELDLLQEVVREAWQHSDREVFVVPLAIFWRKGPRRRSRFLNLAYGSLFRPSDVLKVSSFLATYRSLSVKIGEAVDLRISALDAVNNLAAAFHGEVHLTFNDDVLSGPSRKSSHRQRSCTVKAGSWSNRCHQNGISAFIIGIKIP